MFERQLDLSEEAAALVRSIDWRATPLGDASAWPTSLKTIAGVVFGNRFPMLALWGRNLVQIYNDAFRPILGERHPAALGAPAREVWKDAWEVLGPIAENVLAGGESTWSEHLLVPLTRNGRLVEAYFTFSCGPIPNDDGQVGGVLVTVRETTDQVQEERQLRMLRDLAAGATEVKTSEAACRAALDILAQNDADIPFALLYAIEADAKAARLMGACGLASSAPLCPGRIALVGPAKSDVVWPLADALMHELEVDLTGRIGSLPGRFGDSPERAIVFPLFGAERLVPNGFLVAGVTSSRPFDDRIRDFLKLTANRIASALDNALMHERDKQAVEALAEIDRAKTALFSNVHTEGERARLFALFEHAPVAISVLEGAEHRYVVANQMMRGIIGNRQFIGKSVRAVIPELDGLAVLEMLDHAFQTGQRVTIDELRVELDRGDGTRQERYFNFVYEPMLDIDGKATGLMSFGSEITEHVLARRKLHTLAVEAKIANQAKDEFLAMVGHELRNPLAPIVTALQLMRRRGTASREQAVIERQVDHLTRLVDDLLDISRITRGKVELKKRRIEVADVLMRALEIASPLLEQRRDRVELNVPREGLVIFADLDRMAQVVANLLTNAAKYSEMGADIELEASRDGEIVRLRVRDHGAGIAPEMIGRVFDVFVQQPQSLDRSKGGLGLGLAIVRSLVELHGGSVRAESDGLGCGSEFVVELPAAEHKTDGQLDSARRDGSGVDTNTDSHRVLIVDDNDDLADTLKDALEDLGYRVAVAHDGPAALEAARRFHPNIALVDIGLPVMDGYELAERLRQLPNDGSGMHLVAVTGYGQESDRRRTAAAGFERHLVKPVDLARLERVVRELSL